MAEPKKFGAFAGVFTPSILTILGVIMYLRMGWVVGNAGLLGTIGIVLVAHIISITTGLSISSIATDKKVGAGGVYYVLSRSLGLPIGGALGLTLFVATALSIALYMVGFAEIFNQYIGYGFEANEAGEMVKTDNYINTLRISGSLGLLVLTIIAFISTSVALKSQYFILAAIILSLGSIFMGDPSTITTVAEGASVAEKVGFAAVFAVFFPAVTGFTAGVAMSGDLKDPKKAIPAGTLGSIAVGLVVYLGLTFFINYSVDSYTLIGNSEALFQMALVGTLVYLGVWGATLSSALGGILGGPRILQAMSADKITPAVFARGVGKGNEPRNALILTVLIAEAGILIGDLNVIAEVVSMFYLAAYGFINLSFFLESWASSDFHPTFKVNKWTGLIGFIATFTIMSQLNVMAMIVAILIISSIFYYLSRKQVALGTGDIWQSVWSTIVKKGLKRMEAKQDHKRNWKPNTLLFSTHSKHRNKMIEFSKAVSGQNGIITNFDLNENVKAQVLFPKSKETVEDDELEKYGIFGRKLEVQNLFRGIESIACTFGFSGIEPNTVLMPWPGETEHPVWFTQMTKKLMELDYNVLYLDYDERWGFRKKEKIDLWWRGNSNNSELMLLLAKFILSSPDWSRASVRVLLVNNTNVDYKIIENRIQYVLDQFRVSAEIKVVNNELDKKPVYELMKVHSSEADLIFVGIPEVEEGTVNSFVDRTNNLVRTIGTTLLVKASSQFETTDLKVEHINLKTETESIEAADVILLEPSKDKTFNDITMKFDAQLKELVHDLTENSVERIENYHHRIFSQVIEIMDGLLDDVSTDEELEVIHGKLDKSLEKVEDYISDAVKNELSIVSEEFNSDISKYIEQKEHFIKGLPTKVQITSVFDKEKNVKTVKKRKIRFRTAVQRIWYSRGMNDANEQFHEFGYQNLILLHQSKNLLHDIVWEFLHVIRNKKELDKKVSELKNRLDKALTKIDKDALNLSSNFYKHIRNRERENINQLNEIVLFKKYKDVLAKVFPPQGPTVIRSMRKELLQFPNYWQRNIKIFSSHLVGDVKLTRFSAKLQAFSDAAVEYTESNYLKALRTNIDQMEKSIDHMETAVEKKNAKTLLEADIHLAEEVFLNSELVVGNLKDSINEALSQIPETVELMTAKSINGIRENQGEEVHTENVALRDITEYLVKKGFEDPIHEQIKLFYDQLKRAIGKLINASNVLQSALDTYASSESFENLQATLQTAKIELAEAESQIDTAQAAFETELRDRKENLRKELDIAEIIQQIDSLSQYVRQHKRRKGIKDILQGVNKSVGERIRKTLKYFIQRQQDITSKAYRQKYARSISEQGVLADFMDDIKTKAELPFYYQQLYATASFSEGGALDNRTTEVNQIKKALTRIEMGTPGAILILGAAASGKTFLTTYVSNFLLKGKTFHVHPPINRTRKKEDLSRALKRATGIKKDIHKIMEEAPARSTFILQDLERWWMKSSGGSALLDEIANLIEQYGSTHYFILNANIHSYQLMTERSKIQSIISRTVILAPLNVHQIRDAIWKRHKTGGLIAHLWGESERHLSIGKVHKFLNRFHATSNGNVGMALSQWLACIEEKQDNDLFLNPPKRIDFPALKRTELKNLVYQLTIHHSLSLKELSKLYGREHKNWLERSLKMLKQSKLVGQNEREAYYIEPLAKPYVENWLNELGFIK